MRRISTDNISDSVASKKIRTINDECNVGFYQTKQKGLKTTLL